MVAIDHSEGVSILAFRDEDRPVASQKGELITLDLVSRQGEIPPGTTIALQMQVSWWRDIPLGQKIYGQTLDPDYAVEVTIQSKGDPTHNSSFDYVILTPSHASDRPLPI